MNDSLSAPLPTVPVRQSLALAWVGGLLCAVVAAGAAVTLDPVFLGLAAAIVGLAGGMLKGAMLWIALISILGLALSS